MVDDLTHYNNMCHSSDKPLQHNLYLLNVALFVLFQISKHIQ